MQTSQRPLITKLSGNETQGAVNKQLRAEWGLHGGSCIGYKRFSTLAVDGGRTYGAEGQTQVWWWGFQNIRNGHVRSVVQRLPPLAGWETQDPEIGERVI